MKATRYISIIACTAAMIAVSCTQSLDEVNSRLDKLEGRVTNLESLCSRLNDSMSAMSAAISTIQGSDFVTDVKEIKENGTVVGYEIVFSKAGSKKIYNGKDGDTPRVDVSLGNDGYYYWTVNGEPLKDASGNPVRASAKDGATPQFDIRDGFWYVSADGQNWTRLGEATGPKGDSFFESVTLEGGNLVMVVGGQTYTLPVNASLAIAFDSPEGIVLGAGKTVVVGYTISSSTGAADIDVIPTAGIKAKVEGEGLSGNITMVLSGNVDFEYDKVTVIVTNGNSTLLKRFNFETGRIVVTEEVNRAVTYQGGEFSLSFSSNVECDVIIKEGNSTPDWIGLKQTRTMSDRTLDFVVSPNTGNSRRATITISSERTSDKVVYTVVQYGRMNSLLISHNASSLTSPAFGGSGVEGLVDWGDGAVEEWSSGIRHTYTDGAGSHVADFQTRNANSFTLNALTDIEDINVTNF